MSSVREIAERVGVSTTTVSRALNNDPAVSPKTRELVLAAANSFGYAPSVGRRVTTNIGVAYTGEQTLAHAYDSAVLEGIAQGVDERRFDVVILNLQRDKKSDETFTQFFMRKGVRGALLRTTASSRHVCRAIADEGFPQVVISERFDAPNINYIDCDSRSDSVRATEYLIALGHRRIAFAMHNIPDRDHVDRLEGYREALANHDLPFSERLLFRHKCTLGGGGTVMTMVMSMPERPTAIFFADPLLAVGAVKKAHELGVRIPLDISIVAFDDTEVRHSVYPTMTAVCQDAVALGFEASAALTRMLARSPAECIRRTLPTSFEVNLSTGPPPQRPARVTAGNARKGEDGRQTAG